MRYLMELGRGRLTKHEMVLYVNGRGDYADGKGFIADVRRAEQVDFAAAAAAGTAAAAAAVAAARCRRCQGRDMMMVYKYAFF